MTTAITQQNSKELLTRAATLCLLCLAALLCPALEARAQWVTNGNNINTTNNGHVGVGTTTPDVYLGDTAGSSPMGKIFNIQSNAGFSMLRLTNSAAGRAEMGRITFGSPAYTGAEKRTAVILSRTDNYATDNPSGNLVFFLSNAGIMAERLRINSAGNVGIGTPTPEVALGDTGGGWGAIGTMLNLQSNAGYSMLRITSSNTGASEMGRVTFGSPGFTGAEKRTAVILSKNDTVVTDNPSGSLLFFTSNAGAMAERLRITPAGNIGIGTPAPASALHVVGDLTVTGNISAKYQDVAEWVPSSEKLAVGTVVVVDGGAVNQVLASTSAYATSVAGVVSGQPGLILGEGGEGKALVATTGRVKVKVDATRAPIRAGDLLVSSDVAGVAMRSEPVTVGGVTMHRPGTIIGKALEPLAGGTGEILVLLSLQ